MKKNIKMSFSGAPFIQIRLKMQTCRQSIRSANPSVPLPLGGHTAAMFQPRRRSIATILHLKVIYLPLVVFLTLRHHLFKI